MNLGSFNITNSTRTKRPKNEFILILKLEMMTTFLDLLPLKTRTNDFIAGCTFSPYLMTITAMMNSTANNTTKTEEGLNK